MHQRTGQANLLDKIGYTRQGDIDMIYSEPAPPAGARML
jgi:hypothetical protein